MFSLIIGRVVLAVPLLFAASVLIFLLVFLVPGNPVTTILGDNATPEAIARAEARLGLNAPLLTQYTTWIGQMLTGNMGTSLLDGTSVSTLR